MSPAWVESSGVQKETHSDVGCEYGSRKHVGSCGQLLCIEFYHATMRHNACPDVRLLAGCFSLDNLIYYKAATSNLSGLCRIH